MKSFQSGLNWRTILNKRDNFRAAFVGFDYAKIAKFGNADRARLMADTGIVRNKAKIEATIHNANKMCELVEQEGSLAGFIWRFEPKPDSLEMPQTTSTSDASHDLSKQLKKRGWKFLGSTMIFAFMQAMGLINDHAYGCVIHEKVERERQKFIRPRTR